MVRWYHDLPEDEQEVVARRWGSEEFANWTATFLLSGAGYALKLTMPTHHRDSLDRLLAQRMARRASPGHRPDPVEQVHAYIHQQVANAVQQIDDHTGKYGKEAVGWLDDRLREIQADAQAMYGRLMDR